MPIKHRFVYEWPEGSTPVSFDKWVTMLPPEEKIEFFQARDRQIQYRQEAIDQGLMTIENGCYIWKDQEAANKNKPTDDIWYKYFRRYRTETKLIFKIKEEQC